MVKLNEKNPICSGYEIKATGKYIHKKDNVLGKRGFIHIKAFNKEIRFKHPSKSH